MNPEEAAKTSSNRDKFVSLAEKRTAKALQAIAVIGNLSNKSNYSYTDEDVRKIKKALIRQVNDTIARFGAKNSKSASFTLK